MIFLKGFRFFVVRLAQWCDVTKNGVLILWYFCNLAYIYHIIVIFVYLKMLDKVNFGSLIIFICWKELVIFLRSFPKSL